MTDITPRVAEDIVAALVGEAAGGLPVYTGRARADLADEDLVAVTAEGLSPDGLTGATVPVAVTVCVAADAAGMAAADAVEAAAVRADVDALRAAAETVYTTSEMVRGIEVTAAREDDFAEAGRVVSSLTLTLSLAYCELPS